MATKFMKYNPSFLTDPELMEAFVVRQADLALIMEVVRDNVHASNQHLLIIGPRGSGKTTLSRRVAAEIRRLPELDAKWFPLPYGEESYEVATAGQFWLEAIHHLGTQTRDQKWAAIYQDLLQEPDETRLGQRALAKLMDFADEQGKRLLLIVENLNLMFGEQLTSDDAWTLRQTLMNEKRLMLLGSATSRFDQIASPKHAMYELFRIFDLEPLSVNECQTVWNMVTGKDIPEEQARAVQIITGGNPRLMTILATFGANRAFKSLMEDLAQLVDDHTDYLKSNIDSLPPAERKVFVCLAALWEDSTASEVATAARINTNQASAMLKRLEGRGAVKVVPWKKGKKKYQLAERLYNIYYLMRRGQDGGRVKAVVNFMVQFYGKEQLHEAAADIAREACIIEDGCRKEHYLALQEIINRPEAMGKRTQIFTSIDTRFFALPDVPDELLRYKLNHSCSKSPDIVGIVDDHDKACRDKKWHEAEKTLRIGLTIEPDCPWVWTKLGQLLVTKLNKAEEGERCLRRAVELKPNIASSWAVLGTMLSRKLGKFQEGVESLHKALELRPDDVEARCELGWVLSRYLGKPEEGVEHLRKVVELVPDDAWAWGQLGEVLANQLGKAEEGVEYLRKAIKLNPDDAWAWGQLGEVLASQLGKPEEGVEYLRKAVELNSDDAWAWGILGTVLSCSLSSSEEGIACLKRSVELEPENVWALYRLGFVLALLPDKMDESASFLSRGVAKKPEFAYLLAKWAKEGGYDFPSSILEHFLDSTGRQKNLLNSFACYLMNARKFGQLETIENWVREATSGDDGEKPEYHGTLSKVLVLRGMVSEALEHVAIALAHPTAVKCDIQEPTDVLTTAAAAGLGQKALDILLASPSLPLLEPLAAGLKRYLGLEVKAPQEVKEVAEDVVKRIEHWKQWHAERGTIFELSKPE